MSKKYRLKNIIKVIEMENAAKEKEIDSFKKTISILEKEIEESDE